ncbi:ATP-binding protein [Salinispirillum marinum]|uniref:histidine kinase n=2 Tax=Saccharospirillaceae TaxID=255527 RepID=A0ABV8BFX9_9GAMM
MKIRLRYKLFAVILLANTLLSLAIVGANTRVFNVGFSRYVEASQRQRLEPLAELLAEEYAQQGNWDWLTMTDARQWLRWQQPLMMPRRDGRPAPSSRNAIILLQVRDAEDQRLLGSPAPANTMSWIPIVSDGVTVGSLGFPNQQRLMSELDGVFADQHRRQTRWVGLVALMLAAAISIPAAAMVLRPVTRLKQATHALTQGDYNVQLPVRGSDELADLAHDFNRLANVLQHNLQARQQWIADISHELRTPIAVLKSELEALQDGIRPLDADAVTSLQQEIARLNDLVNDLHQLSLSDVGALSYRFTSLDLIAHLRAMLAQHSTSLVQHHVQLLDELPTTPVLIQGDAQRLTQLWTNLLSNSVKYTTASAERPGYLRLRLNQTADAVILEWSDSSPGVPEEELAKIFDRLYRVDASRNRESGGSGLGLAIVHSVVQAHGGSVTAKTSNLGGLSVCIRLPRLDAGKAAAAE